jgi:hypothetical protein
LAHFVYPLPNFIHRYRWHQWWCESLGGRRLHMEHRVLAWHVLITKDWLIEWLATRLRLLGTLLDIAGAAHRFTNVPGPARIQKIIVAHRIRTKYIGQGIRLGRR